MVKAPNLKYTLCKAQNNVLNNILNFNSYFSMTNIYYDMTIGLLSVNFKKVSDCPAVVLAIKIGRRGIDVEMIR